MVSQATRQQEVIPAHPPASSLTSVEDEPFPPRKSTHILPTTNLWFLPIPSMARYDPDNPVVLSLPLNLLMASAATFTVANLYYSQPILVQLSQEFGVNYNEIAIIPTLNQAGYAIGILLISPLGDLLRRRSLILLLIILTGLLSIPLAITSSLRLFEIISFFISLLTVTPQIVIPLTADLAREEKRAASIAITFSGLTLGQLAARVLSGVITNFSSYKNVYWMAVGTQVAVWILLYFCLPDFPAKTQGVSYFGMLRSMAIYLVTYPLLIQCCLIGLIGSACFSNWWTTLTFLLADPPYNYNPFEIGLFGLVGILGVVTVPFTGKLVDRMVPWLAQLVAIFLQICFQAIAVGAANRSVGAVVVVCWGLDVGLQMGQVSLSTRIYGIKPESRARLNAIFIISLFIGQSLATPSATKLYTEYGWLASSSWSLGMSGLALLLLFSRGPHAKKWIGWDGGTRLVKDRPKQEEKAIADEERGELELRNSTQVESLSENDRKVPEEELIDRKP